MNCLTSAHGIYVYLQLIWSCEKTLDGTEIKDASQQLQIHFNRVDNLNWKHMKGTVSPEWILNKPEKMGCNKSFLIYKLTVGQRL